MIHYDAFTLENGLRVYVHQDTSTPMAAFNLLYNVGSRDEDPQRTGFAHLFEHLMFGGSRHIAAYDEPLQRVGGENNAFTSPDLTNYYITLPAVNLETAFWLESDRMLGLSFDPKVLEVQQKVVVEEFKQRYLNQPYGDVWLHLRPLAYQRHPYRWATIGQEIAHIEEATMADVRAFFYRHYLPNNAILVVAGPTPTEEVERLCAKWFAPIPAGEHPARRLPAEPPQTEARFAETTAAVPLDALYKAWHTPGRYEADYMATELLADVLGRGKSSRLYLNLVKEARLFSSIHAYTTASLDPGLLVIQGNLTAGVSLETADDALTDLLDALLKTGADEAELSKVKNQAEATLAFSEVELLNRAMNLAFAANAGDAELANRESEAIQAVSPDDLLRVARQVLRPENGSTLYYRRAEGAGES